MAEYKAMLQRQREYFRTGETKSVEFRVRQLERMAKWIQDNEEDIMDALKGDLHKSPFEAYATEIGIVKEEIRYTLKHIRSWARPKRVPTPVTQFRQSPSSTGAIRRGAYHVPLELTPSSSPSRLCRCPERRQLRRGQALRLLGPHLRPHCPG